MSDFNIDPPDLYSTAPSRSSRYKWLPLLSAILKIAGVIALVIWICQVLFGCFTLMTSNMGVAERLVAMLAGGFSLIIQLVGILLIFAASELIIVILDIEKSSRHTAETVSLYGSESSN
jgi:hypothetical protein